VHERIISAVKGVDFVCYFGKEPHCPLNRRLCGPPWDSDLRKAALAMPGKN
jgi:hypothetical protein